jgi:hypothetical protein
MSIFEQLMKINVNDKTDKKGKFTYLSWAFAWAELKKVAPDAKVTVYHDEVTNKPYFGLGEAGVLVKVGVEVEGVEHVSYLPCMDFRNQAIPEEDVTAMDINKAIQRATVKAIGLHGLGLYIYAGEDLPEGEEDEVEETSKKKVSKKVTKKKVVKKKVEEPEEEEETTLPAVDAQDVEEPEEKPKRSAAAKARNNFRKKTTRVKSKGL